VKLDKMSPKQRSGALIRYMGVGTVANMLATFFTNPKLNFTATSIVQNESLALIPRIPTIQPEPGYQPPQPETLAIAGLTGAFLGIVVLGCRLAWEQRGSNLEILTTASVAGYASKLFE